MMRPILVHRASISCLLIAAQLSIAYGALNVEQIETSGDLSSPLPVFPGSDDGGLINNLGISTPEDSMVNGGQWSQNQDLFNNEGSFELASGGKNCTPRPNRRGKRRARRDDRSYCPATFQNNPLPNKHQEAGQQQGTTPKMNQDQPKIPGSGDPTPDTAPILLENLDVPQPNSNICPWGIARIPICARWEDADDSKDILPAMGFISDFHDIVHWNRYDPDHGCPNEGEALFCCHLVQAEPILQHNLEEHVPETDLSSPLDPFDGWFPHGHSIKAEPVPEKKIREYTATLCRPGPSPDYPGPSRNNHQSH